MEKRIFLSLLIFFSINLESYSQSNDFLDEFEALIDNENVQLLPDRMILSQKLIWGEKGLLRKTGISKLSIENREKELILREKMLKAHQIIGYVTFAAMIAQGIIGGKLYNGENDLYGTHKNLGNFVTTSYFLGAGLSLLTPPPLVSKEIKGLNNIRAHKILANLHLPAMIATNIYSDRDRDIHKASAYTAFASYTLAIIAITFNF